MKKLAFAFVALSTFDMCLTLAIVNHGGGLELNPIMAVVLAWPLWGIILFKVGLPIVFSFSLAALDKTTVGRFIHARTVLSIVVVVLVAICAFNLAGILKGEI